MKYFCTIILALLSFLGNGQFSEPSVIDTVENGLIKQMFTVDLDNDNQKDIIIVYLYDSISWYKNDNLTFTRMSKIDSIHGVQTHIESHDIDNNGFQDLLICDNTTMYNKVVLLKNLDGGNQWEKVIIGDSIAGGVWRSYFSDIDNDGDLDIIACGDLKIYVYLQDSGGFDEGIIVAGGVEFYNMVVNDFNNDNYPDFIVNSSDGVRHYTNNQDLTFSHTNFNSHLFGLLETADLNNDGNFDFIFPDITNFGNLLTYTNDGDGTFTETQSSEFGVNSNAQAPMNFIDLTGNNFKDAAYITNTHTGIYYSINDESGQFGAPILIDSTYRYITLSCNDMDNDGDNDIVWFEYVPFVSSRIGMIINESTVLNTSNLTPDSFNAFPNPVNDKLHIEYSQKWSTTNIEVIDALGKIHFSSFKQVDFIDMTEWKSGIYFLRIDNQVHRIVKE